MQQVNCYVALYAGESISAVAFFWILSHGVFCVDGVFCVVTGLWTEAICGVSLWCNLNTYMMLDVLIEPGRGLIHTYIYI